MTDLLALICLPFLVVTVIVFFIIAYSQYKQLGSGTNRLNILTTRLALCFPFYAILVYLVILFPIIFVAIEIPISVIMGYSFYTFLVLIVTNLGGPQETVRLMNESHRRVRCCFCCLLTSKEQLYNIAVLSTFHLMVTRTALLTVAVVLHFVRRPIATLLEVIIQVVVVLQLVQSLLAVANLCAW
jgi:hypothetical protein